MKRNKLSDMEYDEISLVGRPANQDSLVSFAKSATLEDSVEEDLYDETGAPVDVDELEPGDVVYTNDGQAFEFVIEDDEDEEEVGKAAWDKAAKFASNRYAVRGALDMNKPGVKAPYGITGYNKKKMAMDAAGATGVTAGIGGTGYAMGRSKAEKSASSSNILEDLSKALHHLCPGLTGDIQQIGKETFFRKACVIHKGYMRGR